jgi:hypothetical protein
MINYSKIQNYVADENVRCFLINRESLMPVFAKVQKKTKSAHLLSPLKPNLATDKPAHAVNSPLIKRGNQAIQQMLRLGKVQAKLRIGQPDDKYKQEADQVAVQVMRMPDPLNAEGAFSGHHTGIGIQRAFSECDEEELHHQPLEEEEEEIFNTKKKPLAMYDFSQLKNHTDTSAIESARAVNARAYTMERNIVLGAGQYTPWTSTGKNAST